MMTNSYQTHRLPTPIISYRVYMASKLQQFKAHFIQSHETYTYSLNLVNLAQAIELSLWQEEPLAHKRPTNEHYSSRNKFVSWKHRH